MAGLPAIAVASVFRLGIAPKLPAALKGSLAKLANCGGRPARKGGVGWFCRGEGVFVGRVGVAEAAGEMEGASPGEGDVFCPCEIGESDLVGSSAGEDGEGDTRLKGVSWFPLSGVSCGRPMAGGGLVMEFLKGESVGMALNGKGSLGMPSLSKVASEGGCWFNSPRLATHLFR